MSFIAGGRVGFTVRGLNEILQGIAAEMREMQQTKMQIHREASEFLAKDWKANVHWITHKTQRSIKVESVTPQMGVVSAGFGAPSEEKRGGDKPPPKIGGGTGPHASGKQAATRTAQQMPSIIKKNIDILFNRHKTR